MQKKNTLGKVIRTMRKLQGMTQTELAQRAGLERTSITNIELGNQTLTEKSLNAIADALGYTAHVTFRKK